MSVNPCGQLERPKATPALPRGLTASDIKKLLEAIPGNPVGLRDRAIILTLTLTGRRRAEVLNLKAGDLTQVGDAVLYSYRGKGGKQSKRELPQPAYQVIQVALAAFGKDFATMSLTNPCGLPVATAARTFWLPLSSATRRLDVLEKQ